MNALTVTYLLVGRNRKYLLQKLSKAGIAVKKLQILDEKRAKITIDKKLPSSQNTVLSWNVYVDKLELVYVRVPMADNPGHYYLIPTWVAYGGHGIDEQIRNNAVVTVGSRHSGNGEPIAFINAIDGTPVDFINGY